MGVEAGMVRAKIDCKAGLDAFIETYKRIGATRNGKSVLEEWFGAAIIKRIETQFNSANSLNKTWTAQNGKSIKQSVEEALIDGVGKPILKLMDYLEFNHSIHCLPNDFSSGLGNLPVADVYVNGKPGKFAWILFFWREWLRGYITGTFFKGSLFRNHLQTCHIKCEERISQLCVMLPLISH